jgi:hypothetical protein
MQVAMSKAMLCSALVSTGAAAAVLAALRFISEPEPPRGSFTGAPLSASPGRAASPARGPRLIELGEMRIQLGSRRRAPARHGVPRSAPRSPEPPELVPCSDWREIGPVFSARAGEIPRQRRVQLLCPVGSSP